MHLRSLIYIEQTLPHHCSLGGRPSAFDSFCRVCGTRATKTPFSGSFYCCNSPGLRLGPISWTSSPDGFLPEASLAPLVPKTCSHRAFIGLFDERRQYGPWPAPSDHTTEVGALLWSVRTTHRPMATRPAHQAHWEQPGCGKCILHAVSKHLALLLASSVHVQNHSHGVSATQVPVPASGVHP